MYVVMCMYIRMCVLCVWVSTCIIHILFSSFIVMFRCHSLRWCVSLCVSIRQNNTTHTHTCFQNNLYFLLFISMFPSLIVSLPFSFDIISILCVYLYNVTHNTQTHTHIHTYPYVFSPSISLSFSIYITCCHFFLVSIYTCVLCSVWFFQYVCFSLSLCHSWSLYFICTCVFDCICSITFYIP